MSEQSVQSSVSRRPRSTKFHQQQLKGWTPNCDPWYVGRILISCSLLYLVVGTVIIAVSVGIVDIWFDYTYCQNKNGITCADQIHNRSMTNVFAYCECFYSFKIHQEFKSPIYFYYMLGNFYQNHRQYLKSRDYNQLHGDYVYNLNQDCEPQRYANVSELIGYAPCGLVANSKFNDTFLLHYESTNWTIPVLWSNSKIAWNIDRTVLFGRPNDWNNTIKPENWKLSSLENNIDAYSGDEELLVWMRPAPLQYFKKLHRIIYSGKEPFETGLPEGNYTLIIKYAFPVKEFKGSKSVFFTTTSIMGGKNIRLPIMFLTMSAIHLTLGITLIYLEKYSDDKIQEYIRESLISDL